MLDEVKNEVSAEDFMRAKYVIGEKERVLAVCDALEKGDYETVGQGGSMLMVTCSGTAVII